MNYKEKYRLKVQTPYITTPLTRFMKDVIEVLNRNNLLYDEILEERLYRDLYEETCKDNLRWLENDK